MKGYIEQGGLVVCSFDTSGTPRKLQVDGSKRAVTVQWKSKGAPLLTIVDKAIDKQFTCKSPMKFWGGLGALLLGIAIGAACVLTGGALAVVLIVGVAAFAAGAAAGYVIAKHSCNSALSSSPDWTNFHTTVKIDKKGAILYNQSILNCKNGGILIATPNETTANKIASAVSNNNSGEIAIHMGSQFVEGFIAGRLGVSGEAGLGTMLWLGSSSATMYAIGETIDEKPNIIVNVLKFWGIDKNITLITESAKAAKNVNYKFFPHAGIELGKGAATLGTSLVIEHFSNQWEDSLKNENNDSVLALADCNSGGSINAIKYNEK